MFLGEILKNLIEKSQRKHLVIVITIMIIGLFYALVQHQYHLKDLNEQIRQALQTRINFIGNGIVERMEQYALGVSSLSAAIVAQGYENTDYRHVKLFSDAQDYPHRYKGARGFGVIKPVAMEHQQRFIAIAQVERPDKSFTLTQLSEHDQTRYIIQYIFPENVNKKAIGLDIGSESNRRTTAVNAALNNETTLSKPITLVQASGKVEHGFLLIKPMYKGQITPNDESEIEQTVYAWTYAPLLIGEILETVTQIGQDKLTISDVDEQTPFFENQAIGLTGEQYVEQSFALFGRVWKIKLFASEPFLRSLNLPNKYVGITQGTVTTLVALLIYFIFYLIIQRKAQQAQHHIDLAATREEKLSLSNTRLSTEVAEKSSEIKRLSILQESILNSAAYAVIATDESGTIKLFNPAAEKLLGYKASELVDKLSPAVFHLESEVVEKAQLLTKELGENVEPGFDVFVIKAKKLGIDSNQWTYVTKSGQHIQVKLSVTALVDGNNEPLGYLGIAYDLTNSLKHEHELKEAKEKAELASQAKSEFLANMSHEIRTPLNGIYGTIQLLKEQELTADNRALINTAYHSTKALITIINDILDFSKIEAGKLALENEIFKLPILVEQLNSELSIFVQSEELSLNFTNHVAHQYWRGDIVRIRQILINLVSNAIKFTEHGTVSVEVTVNEQGALVFTVADTGIGIEKSKLDKLFNRFEQADTSITRKFGGTGLGLAITERLVQLMDGSIDVTSEVNIGTTISVTLPLKKIIQDENHEDVNSESYPNLQGKSILVVEDNKINQLVISKMLSPTQAEISVANNGVEGIEKFRACRPDIIFMDIQMPVMDGLTACKAIKSEHAEQVIVALTANAIKSQQDLYKEIFDGYLSKPLEREKLIKLLNGLEL